MLWTELLINDDGGDNADLDTLSSMRYIYLQSGGGE
jgi:hypothetical protein